MAWEQQPATLHEEPLQHSATCWAIRCSVLYKAFSCCVRLLAHCSLLRSFSSAPAGKTSYGGLSDEDRIFTNIYGFHDPFLKVRALHLPHIMLHPPVV